MIAQVSVLDNFLKTHHHFFSQPQSEDIPFCPAIHFHSACLSLSYTYTHLEENMLLLGKKHTN